VGFIALQNEKMFNFFQYIFLNYPTVDVKNKNKKVKKYLFKGFFGEIWSAAKLFAGAILIAPTVTEYTRLRSCLTPE
jgi:hypothetical protein